MGLCVFINVLDVKEMIIHRFQGYDVIVFSDGLLQQATPVATLSNTISVELRYRPGSETPKTFW